MRLTSRFRIEGNSVREFEKNLPVAKSVDVLVVGGGSAGSPAAIAAGRMGANVLLVDRNECLGGTSTCGMMGQFGAPYEYAHGMMKEIIDRLITKGHAKPGPFTLFDPEAFKWELMQMALDAKVKMLLYTWVADTIVEDGWVRGVIVENKSGRQAILASTFIDASGDGDVAFHAGINFHKGRETDGKMRPMTLLFRLGNIDVPKVVEYALKAKNQFHPDPNYNIIIPENKTIRLTGFFDLIENARKQGDIDPNIHYMRFEDLDYGRGTTIVNTVRVYNVDGTNADDLTKAEIAARKQVHDLVKFVSKYVPGCERAYLVDTASNMGVRETRHIQGEYQISEDDILNGVAFEDSIAKQLQRNVPKTEVHSPEPGEGAPDDKRERVSPWEAKVFYLPYRALIAKGVNNLLAVGRCLSATHQADGWTRSIPCCVAMGQAAGVAAAIAMKGGGSLKEIDVRVLRQVLKEQGVTL